MRITMRLVLVLTFIIASTASGEVSTRVCMADGNTPFLPAEVNIPVIEYPDIMVGTELTIIVSSDANGYWDGGLFISVLEKDYGVISGRDFNEITLDWEGSRFPTAGKEARVFDWQDDIIIGFDLYGCIDAVVGDWFILDYTAIDMGSCIVGFYDSNVPNGMDYPVYEMAFSHVPTRDFNNDTIVNFWDYAQFATYWQTNDCNDPNTFMATDLDANGSIDINDLILFSDYWLEKTR
jgi:hypothetical protein